MNYNFLLQITVMTANQIFNDIKYKENGYDEYETITPLGWIMSAQGHPCVFSEGGRNQTNLFLF